jgi:hypothetical protein
VRRLLSMFAVTAAAGMIIPAAAGAAAANAITVPSSFGTRLASVPASEANDPRALEYIIGNLTPGTVIRRRILIANDEPHRSHFTVYPDAAHISNGTFNGDTGQTTNELTTWISIQHRRVTMRPHSSVKDLVTIRVPRVATRGEHYGVVWVQQVGHAATGHGVTVAEVNRVGIRIYLAIGQGGTLPTRFKITKIAGHRSAAGQQVLTARIRNTGGLAVDLSGTARLSAGPGGISAGPFGVRKVVTLAPGQSGTLTFPVPSRLPSGPWRARVTAVSGLNKATASATIDFSGHLPSGAWVRTSAMIGGSGLGLALLMTLMVRARRRRWPARRQLA